MNKKWFKKHYQWVITGVSIPIIFGILSLLNSPEPNQKIQNISADEISGGVIGNNNTITNSRNIFPDEHIKLIESRRQYINQNIEDWYKYEDGEKYYTTSIFLLINY